MLVKVHAWLVVMMLRQEQKLSANCTLKFNFWSLTLLQRSIMWKWEKVIFGYKGRVLTTWIFFCSMVKVFAGPGMRDSNGSQNSLMRRATLLFPSRSSRWWREQTRETAREELRAEKWRMEEERESKDKLSCPCIGDKEKRKQARSLFICTQLWKAPSELSAYSIHSVQNWFVSSWDF